MIDILATIAVIFLLIFCTEVLVFLGMLIYGWWKEMMP